MRARGGSMGRAIPDDSIVELAPITSSASLGTVVAVHSKSGLFLIHRVIGIASDGRVLTMGDAHDHADGWFTPDEVVATVQRVDRGTGFEPVSPKPLPRPRTSLLRRAGRRLLNAVS